MRHEPTAGPVPTAADIEATRMHLAITLAIILPIEAAALVAVMKRLDCWLPTQTTTPHGKD